MKKFILVTMLLTSMSILSAQTISGILFNAENNEPVVGASVIIKGTYSGATTDIDGRFALKTSKETLTLIIRHLSFETTEVEAITGSELSVTLQPKAFLSDEVLVSATRAPKQIAPTYTNISQEEIAKQNLGQDLPYLLEQTPSIVTASDAGAGVGYTYMWIRGSDQSRINVTINGIPYNDPESQQVFWVNLPDFASTVDNIQVQRGLGTSTNGAAAFGASVNIQTTTLQTDPYGELSGSYGSFNTWKTTARFGTGLIKNKFTVDGRLSKIASDGFVDRASSDLKSFFVSGGYHGKKTIVRLNVFSGQEETYQAWWGVPQEFLDTNRTYNYYNYPDEVDRYRQDHYQVLFSQQAGKNWTLNLALFYVRGKGYFEQYRGPEFNNDFGFNSKQRFSRLGLEDVIVGDDTITRTSLVRRRWLDNHFYGTTFSALYEKNKLNLTLGGAANRYDGDHYGELPWMEFAGNLAPNHRFYEGNGSKDDVNFFVKAGYQLTKKLHVFADLQYRFVGYRVTGSDVNLIELFVDDKLHFFNPKFGLNYRLNNNHEVFGYFGIGNREPARRDFVDAPEDRQPVHETMRNLEAGYRFIKAKNLLSINFYLMHYKNQLVLTGELNDVGAPIKTNVDKSYRAGVELVNTFRPIEKFQWDATLTYSINRINAFTEVLYVYDGDYNFIETISNEYANTDISFSPFLIGGSTLSYFPVKDLQIAFISKYVSRQFLDNTGSSERQLNGFFVNNIRLNYSLKEKFFKEIIFSVLLNNIFNAKYEPNGYVFTEVYEDETQSRARVDYNYFYPQAGFNVLGGVTLRF